MVTTLDFRSEAVRSVVGVLVPAIVLFARTRNFFFFFFFFLRGL